MYKTYIVVAGDTLYGISKQFGVSVNDLINLNNIKNNIITIGQELLIPNNLGNNPDNLVTYIVKKGDSLYGIAMKYGTNVSELIKINNLKSTSLAIGQTLNIPENYNNNIELPEYKTYIVKKGDTLYNIAKNNNIDIETLIKDNSLTNNNLAIGQILRIRTSGETSKIEECFGEDYNPVNENIIIYKVKKGDSLYKIANNYNTSVSAVMNLNNLKSTSLAIGQELKIPSTSSSVTYIVKKGDSLYTIAKKYNTTVDSIKKKNNLKSNVLQIGQSLII